MAYADPWRTSKKLTPQGREAAGMVFGRQKRRDRTSFLGNLVELRRRAAATGGCGEGRQPIEKFAKKN
jgi:hypothetical protein